MKGDDINIRIARLEEFLRENSHEFESNSISNHSFYSYRHSNRLFALQKGESIKSFSNKIRLQKAAEYLRYSTRNILDIAFEVGYETSASFSKAFKKAYRMSPSAYREQHKETDHAKIPKTSTPIYTIQKLDLSNLRHEKITFDINIPDENFYNLVKTSHLLSTSSQQAFMLLWDEDPYTVQSDKSRCFLALPSLSPIPSNSGVPDLAGKYAIFDTSDFSRLNAEAWHRIAFLLLELDEVKMRLSTFVEFYTTDALDHIDNFFPKRIAISVE
ncbi:MAG: helix-turn-helix transcriptional regulator [Cyanothece sp. SIO1E1]|nr:helix-turn-helix transcriptional regulator [Cyanothece sp. SIO1E1]